MNNTKLKVLLIEDNPDDIRLFREMLKTLQKESEISRYELSMEKTVEGAIKRLEKGNFDLILLDLYLPDSQVMDGLARIQNQTVEVPIIILADRDNAETAAKAMEEGAQDFLVKEYVDSHLLAYSMRHAIGSKKEQTQLQERVKELGCLYRINHDMQKELPLDQLCERIVEHLIPGMQFPAITVPVIEIDGKRFTSKRYGDKLTHGLQKEINIGGEVRGRVAVYYTQENPFLIPEEEDLINAIAEDLSLWIGREEAHQALKESERKYRSLFENVNTGVAVHGADGSIIAANPVAEEVLGLPEKQLREKNPDYWQGKLYKENGEKMNVSEFPVSKIFDTGKSDEGTVIGVSTAEGKDISWYIHSAVPQFNENGEIESIITSFKEITARKETEEKLKASEQKYRSLAENATDVLAQIDLEGNFTYMSKSAEEETGYTREEVKKLNIKDVLTEKSYKKSMQRINEWIKGAEDLPPYEVEVESKDGNIIPFELNTSPIYEDDKLKAIHIIARNISRRKQVERELKESHKQLEQALEGTVNALASTLEQRDAYTAGHQKKVTQLALAIAQKMSLPEERIEGLRVAGTVHDIGKINVPVEILSKPTELGDTEMDLVKAHAQIGYEILKDVDFPWPVADIVHQHHERLDGSGYPQGLGGDEIRLEAKILGVADVVEAMNSHRPYRAAKGLDRALEEIKGNKGKLYDSQVVEACMKVFEEGFEFEEGG